MTIANGRKHRIGAVRQHKTDYFWRAVNYHFDNPTASTAEYLHNRANKLKEVKR